MKIGNEHLYHGAVLNQIAEHPQFTAINALRVGGETSRSAFKINNDIAVYIHKIRDPTDSAISRIRVQLQCRQPIGVDEH